MTIDNHKLMQSLWESKYIPSDNWVVCDICGFKVRASKTRYNHDGLLVCSKDWEPRHPQETIRHVKEKIVPDKMRVEQEDTYIANEADFPFALGSETFGYGSSVPTVPKVTADDL